MDFAVIIDLDHAVSFFYAVLVCVRVHCIVCVQAALAIGRLLQHPGLLREIASWCDESNADESMLATIAVRAAGSITAGSPLLAAAADTGRRFTAHLLVPLVNTDA